MSNDSFNLSGIRFAFCKKLIKEYSGPYKNDLQIVNIVNSIYCIMFNKGVLRNKKPLNFTNSKAILALKFSNACEELNVKHCIRYKNHGYSGFYFYVGTWDAERDIINQKKWLSMLNENKKLSIQPEYIIGSVGDDCPDEPWFSKG